MRIVLKDFQTDYVAELGERFRVVQDLAGKGSPAAVLLNAPTGSGKTMMVTALIEELLAGSDTNDGDPDLVFLWLTDQPELNKQTYDKMVATSTVLREDDLTIIDASLDEERLAPGRVYFLNTQKLGVGTSFVRTGDDRNFSLWETLRNTVAAEATRFVLIIDEAHRGTKGKEAEVAESIVQKFLKGNGEMAKVPLVIGVSATPDRFVALCNSTNRPVFRVDVDAERVRESGLLKEFVDLYHPDEAQKGDVTMLVQAVADWQDYQRRWIDYGEQQNEPTPSPVLLVQVEDARSKATGRSKTDLGRVVGTLAKELGPETTQGWLAHAFQDDVDFTEAGHNVRHIAPSDIDADADVKVVLFKTSLNTGWDCPRAEVMVSFRTAKDETNIAQLVGRMVRAPLARRVDADEHLNTVALYLPFYDRKAVEKVIARLTGDPGSVPPTHVRGGQDAVFLTRAPDKDACFAVLEKLPTYTVPRTRPMKPVARLGKLASLLAETSLETDPVKSYRAALVQLLVDERKRLANDAAFVSLIDEAKVLDIRRRRHAYGVIQTSDDAAEVEGDRIQVVIADQNIDDLYEDVGRRLGEGLHKEYFRTRFGEQVRPRDAKLELYALVSTAGVLEGVSNKADELRRAWVAEHKASFAEMDERFQQALRDIEGAGADPELTLILPQPTVEWSRATQEWPDHLYVGSDGKFRDDFAKSSWERKVVEVETKRPDFVGWLRNLDRKPWSLCIPRKEGLRWVPFYPDFIFFRKIKGGVIADIIDPHLMSADDMPQRAVRLAQYANDHADKFGRIEMVIYENAKDSQGKRLDLIDETVRAEVANVTTREQLKRLFSAG